MTERVISDQLLEALEAQRVAAVLTRYSVACDERDGKTLAALFHPEATASYDVDADLVGNQAIADWICEATSSLCWQQHALRVMSVDVVGDQTDHRGLRVGNRARAGLDTGLRSCGQVRLRQQSGGGFLRRGYPSGCGGQGGGDVFFGFSGPVPCVHKHSLPYFIKNDLTRKEFYYSIYAY